MGGWIALGEDMTIPFASINQGFSDCLYYSKNHISCCYEAVTVILGAGTDHKSWIINIYSNSILVLLTKLK